MTFTQLEYIIAVSREGNFRKAALSCFVTQPTLSAQIHKVEDELGIVLFDRRKSPTVPTKIGKMIVEQAKIGLYEIGKISEIVKDEQGLVQGSLSVGIIPTISPYLTPLFLDKFCKKYPDVELSIFELTTQNCLEKLDNEEIDFAILATKENQSIYIQDHLYSEELLLFLNKKHSLLKKNKVKVSDIRSQEIWLLEEGHCLRDEVIEVCSLRKELEKRPAKVSFKVGSLESLKYIVKEQSGYTLMPELAVKYFSKSEKKFLRKLSPSSKRSVYLTKRRRFLKRTLIDAFAKTVLSNVSI